ncbi:MAG: class I adenylate-forming enzyme family protein [Chloroflexota bacterium]
MNIGTILPRHARYRPDHTALVFEGTRLSYRELNAQVNQLANALLGLGIRPGEKVATILPNSVEVVCLYWAVARTGMAVVPLSPMLRGDGLANLLHDSDAIAVFTTQAMVEQVDPLRGRLPNILPDRYFLIDSDDTPGYRSYAALVAGASAGDPPAIDISDEALYNIIYSSGTTGQPKGIMHTHYVRAMYCQGFAASYRITPESVVLHTGSLVFNGAFLTFMPAFYQGATYILHPYFDTGRMIETVAAEQVTHVKMVPSQIVALLNHPDFDPERLRSLQMIGTVGAPLHMEHKRRLMDALPGRFYELYGLTEGFVTILDKSVAEQKPESVGAPPPLYEMRICDPAGNDLPPGEVGEIVGRGPILMAGYYKRPDLTQNTVRDGWLYTGDLGYMDADGYLYLVDRKKDLIISGGVNVFPRDIEEIVVQHPAVVEAAVFGVPDDKWGEAPVAAVILSEPDAISAEALRDWVNERVQARYQKLREVILREQFPRSVAGKTLKRVMRDEFWQGDTKI